MNKWIGIGRLVADPEIRYTQGTNAAVANYRIAIDRKYKKDGDDQTADFITCVTFGKLAEFAEKYLKKGMKIAVVGRIQTSIYRNKEGKVVYTTDVVVEEQEFCESKNSNKQNGSNGVSINSTQSSRGDGWMNIPDGIDSELPFN